MKNGRPKKAKEKKRETLKNKKCPFFGEKQVFQLERKTKKKTKKTKKNQPKKTCKEGLGPSEVALRATLPDPQTLKETPPPKKNTKNTKIPKNNFSAINQCFSFLVGVQDFPFLTTWPKKCAHKKTQ